MLTVSFLCFGQDKDENRPKFDLLKFEFEKECGSPLTESNLFAHREGRIVAVNSANEVTFEALAQTTYKGSRPKGTFIVKLAGIWGRTNESALKKFLTDTLLGKEVEIVGNTEAEGDKSFYGIIRGGGLGDVNRHLLETGMARFKRPPYASVWRYNLCVYEQVAKQAEAAKLGIWER